MSMEGWWMVQTTVRPVLTVLRTVRMTIAAARASRPEQAANHQYNRQLSGQRCHCKAPRTI